VLAKQRFNLRERNMNELAATFVPFSAQTRMSGVNIGAREVRKGAASAIRIISRRRDRGSPMRSRAG